MHNGGRMGRTILIVDDNETNLRLIGAVLRTRGYALREATTGEMALAIVAETSLDMVLLDVQMPGLSGLDVVRQIRAIPAHRALPVIAITAMAMKGDREAVLAAGFTDYLAKPYRTADVLALVARHLPSEET